MRPPFSSVPRIHPTRPNGGRLDLIGTVDADPTRRWLVELAPLSRLQAWKAEEIKPGDAVAILGFTFAGEKGDAIVRAEYLFHGGKVYGLRSSPV